MPTVMVDIRSCESWWQRNGEADSRFGDAAHFRTSSSRFELRITYPEFIINLHRDLRAVLDYSTSNHPVSLSFGCKGKVLLVTDAREERRYASPRVKSSDE